MTTSSMPISRSTAISPRRRRIRASHGEASSVAAHMNHANPIAAKNRPPRRPGLTGHENDRRDDRWPGHIRRGQRHDERFLEGVLGVGCGSAGKIIRNAMRNNTMPPAIRNASGVSFNSAMNSPPPRNTSSSNASANRHSRRITRVRRSSGTALSADKNNGMFPSGSMTSSRVSVAAVRSMVGVRNAECGMRNPNECGNAGSRPC